MTAEVLPLLERIATALEQIALELVDTKTQPPARPAAPQPVSVAPAAPQGPFQPIGWTCPYHGTVKVIPAGISKRTNQPYEAFSVCAEQGCNEKPPRNLPIPARAIPPSQGNQLP